LVEHLTSRFEELYDSLDFIVENAGIDDRAEALRRSQYAAAAEAGQVIASFKALDKYRSSVDLHSIAALADRIADIASARDRVEAFARFADIEGQLEPIEEPVHNAAAGVDEAIQAETDRRRGK
jgi:hypothetical protein